MKTGNAINTGVAVEWAVCFVHLPRGREIQEQGQANGIETAVKVKLTALKHR